ncbi:flippase [Winogradskyella poriferorum]|uniref:flippase n=1 Tax=Winogradskyella poriferorum TaxID=307627 RepID=UPI003D659428
MLLNNNLRELLSKAGIYFLFRVFGFLFAYIFALFVIKKFGSETYGLVTLSFTFIVIGSAITRLGFDVHLTKVFSSNLETDTKTNLYVTSFIISVVISFIIATSLYLLSNFISTHIFFNQKLQPYLKWGAITLPFLSIVLINSGVFRGLKRNTLFSIFNTFGRFFLATIFTLIFVYILNRSSEWVIIGHFLGLALLAVVSLIIIFKLLRPLGQIKWDSTLDFTKDSVPILMALLVVMLLDWTDKIFLGIFEDESKVGVYDIVFRIAVLIKFCLEAINSILAPKISEFYHCQQFDELQKIVSYSTKLNTYISLLIFVGIIVFCNPILLFLGEDFIEGQIALIILAFGQLIGSLSGSVGVILQMTGHQKIFRNIAIVALVLNVILNVVLINLYGLTGAAIATTTSLITLNVLSAFYIKKMLKITSYYQLTAVFSSNSANKRNS